MKLHKNDETRNSYTKSTQPMSSGGAIQRKSTRLVGRLLAYECNMVHIFLLERLTFVYR